MAVQAADPQALFLQDLGRQDAVQAAGKKHDHIHRPLVSIDHAGRGGGLEIGGSVHHGPPSTRKRGQEARARPGFSQLGDRIFRPAAPLRAPCGVGDALEGCLRYRANTTALLSRRMSVPFDGPGRRRCAVGSGAPARHRGPGAGEGAGRRNSAPRPCRRAAGPSPLDNY